MKLGTRFGLTFSLAVVSVAVVVLAGAGIVFHRQALHIEEGIRAAVAAAGAEDEDPVLRSTAWHLSGQLFGSLYDLDIRHLSSDMDQVRSWLPVRSFFVTDPSGFVLTDGTEANTAYGMVMIIPALPEEGVVIERTTGETELRFPIRSGDVIAGWGFLTLEERPFRRSLRNIEEGTGAVLSGFRRSLLSLGLGVVLVTLALGIGTSLWLSRTLSRPLVEMSETAARFASRDFHEASVPESGDEVEALGVALNAMARDLRDHHSALEAERDLVRQIIETSPVGIVTLDEQGRVRFTNGNAESLLGVCTSEADWPLRDESGLEVPVAERPLARVKKEGRSLIDVRYVAETPERGAVPVSLNAAALNRPDGSIDGLVVTLQDTGERRRAEKERERLIGELEAKNEELERFAYTISHDIKSPLISIRGFAGFLEDDIREGNMARVAEDLGRIGAATDSMTLLLDAVLKLSRSGRVVDAADDVPLGEIAREAARLVEGRLAGRAAVVAVDETLPVRRVDRARMLEVFVNLLENAIKFMGGQPLPRIEVGRQRRAGEEVFFVRDNGIGIAPEHASRVFRMFEKLDVRAEGTGLGLSLVQRIIVAHGGRVWAESEGLGLGTTILFTLPEPKPLT